MLTHQQITLFTDDRNADQKLERNFKMHASHFLILLAKVSGSDVLAFSVSAPSRVPFCDARLHANSAYSFLLGYCKEFQVLNILTIVMIAQVWLFSLIYKDILRLQTPKQHINHVVRILVCYWLDFRQKLASLNQRARSIVLQSQVMLDHSTYAYMITVTL